jgi:hypothetical protein
MIYYDAQIQYYRPDRATRALYATLEPLVARSGQSTQFD